MRSALGCKRIALLPGGAVLTWLIYLPYREGPDGPRGSCWLFVDSADAIQMRRLRSRLTLEQAG